MFRWGGRGGLENLIDRHNLIERVDSRSCGIGKTKSSIGVFSSGWSAHCHPPVNQDGSGGGTDSLSRSCRAAGGKWAAAVLPVAAGVVSEATSTPTTPVNPDVTAVPRWR